MNTYTLPGFTAEASLYKTTEQYDLRGAPNAPEGEQQVLPQRTKLGGPNCYSDCIRFLGGASADFCRAVCEFD
jgi:hypothetical protein